MARQYNTFADFEREEIRPGMRIGWSLEDIEEPSREQVDFDADPFEAMWDSPAEDDEEEED